jgi:hypothetical protein
VTKTEREAMRNACCDLFRIPTTETLSHLLTEMLRQSVAKKPSGLREFVSEPTQERLNELIESVPPECEDQIQPYVSLCRAFYRFEQDRTEQNLNDLFAVLPPLNASLLNAVAYVVFLSRPSVQHSLNVRFEITLKQRCATELTSPTITKKRLKAPAAHSPYTLSVMKSRHHVAEKARYRLASVACRKIDGLDRPFPVKVFEIASLPVQENARRRTKPRPPTLAETELRAPFYYLSDDEARRIAVRVMNRLNKTLFGRAARRKQDRQRLTALICQHDKGTRRHLHVLLALPPDTPLSHLEDALEAACRTEPFFYRFAAIQHVNNLAASILYNANDFKSLSTHPIIYVNTQADPEQPTNGGPQNEREPAAPDRTDGAAANDGDRVRPSHTG